MIGRGDWVLLDAVQFVDNLFLSLRNDDPLLVSIRRIFTAVLGKMMRYGGCTHGIHLLSNCIHDTDERLATLEIDHLYVDPISTKNYMASALNKRQGDRGRQVEQNEMPPYVRSTWTNTHDALGVYTDLKERFRKNGKPCSCSIQKKTEWVALFDAFNHGRKAAIAANQNIAFSTDEILVIPLSEGSPKLTTGHLGTILLWNNQEKAVSEVWKSREERLILAAKILSGFVSRLLETRYDVSKETYLPSYRVAGQKSVAILFADIRGFTPATEILRNFNRVPELTQFMLEYCRSMCEIVADQGGRVHGLAGDGIMALFGEYESDYRKVAASAVTSARLMVRKFDEIKKKFFGTESMSSFFETEYEPMDFGLGIGINFGPVIFDYFGAIGSRVYSPLGDHVNFAQRLETQAARFDDHLRKLRAPILLSRPVYLLTDPNGTATPLTLEMKGKPYQYHAYECWPEHG